MSGSFSPYSVERVDRLLPAMMDLKVVDLHEQITFISERFSEAADKIGVNVPSDFLKLALDAMRHLAGSGRSNVIYGLAKGMGTLREDGRDSVFPVKRVITGLVEYSVNFFNAGEAQNVRKLHYVCAWRYLSSTLGVLSKRL